MMMSNKKSYAMKMLQLALALSLLHVDPDNYLQQQLHNWDSQLELRDGDGWELEMLRAVPMMEYPYANRKTMMPLIDDLVHFDSIIRDVHPPSPYNITAYLLNISHEGSNETLAMQDIQTPSTLAAAQTTNSTMNVASNISTLPSNTAATGLARDNNTVSPNSSVTYSENSNGSYVDINVSSPLSTRLSSLLEQHDDSSYFLDEQRSVWEQNLADLNDFNDLPIISTPYAYLTQIKDADQTPPPVEFQDLHLEDFLPSISSINVECESTSTPTITSTIPTTSSTAFEGATALNGSFPHPDNNVGIKVEQLDDNDDTKNWRMNFTNNKGHLLKHSSNVHECAEGLCIKSGLAEINQMKIEPLDDVKHKEDTKDNIVMLKNNNNPFINQVEFTKEESELVEVLWKQDIDLGYSLNLPQQHETQTSSTTNNDKNNGNNKVHYDSDANTDGNVNSDNDLEKLKALEELKLNNHNEFISNDLINNDDNQLVDDDWSGIPFTIDNETGEYIRLPLDEILDDVIQFAEFVVENDQISNNDVKENNSSNSYATGSNNSGASEPAIVDIKVFSPSSLTDCDLAATVAQEQVHNSDLNKRNSESEADLRNNDFSIAIDSIKSEDNNNRINQVKRDESISINKETSEEDGDNNLIQFDDVDCLSSPLFDLDDEAKEELADLDMMLHSTTPFASHHHPHSHPHPHAHTHTHSHGHPQTHPHPHAHHHLHHHPHHARAGGTGLTQHYGSVNSAFHRQPTTSAGFHHASHQDRVPLTRGVSMEQRLQDIASLFNPIPSMGVGVGVGVSIMGGVSEMSPYHYPTHHYSYQTPVGADGVQHGQYSASVAAPPPPPPPPSHTHTHAHLQHSHAAAMHHANASSSLNDLCSSQPHYGHNLGSAVSSSMHLTNSTHGSDNVDNGSMSGGHMSAYKMEHHDIMYYTNASSSDINHTTDGFINSILNDEDLHLMDMNVNENFCRMVDVNNCTSNNSSVLGLPNHLSGTNGLTMSDGNTNIRAVGVVGGGDGSVGGNIGGLNGELMVVGGSGATDRLDASSDSAVSSMGSERVSSLSDGEWGEGSDSAQDYHPGKYDGGGDGGGTSVTGGPYDYSYNNGGTTNNNHNNHNNNNRQPTVAQKKHHMFGKRFINEQSSNANAMTNARSSMDRVHHEVAGQSIKYEYESYAHAPLNGSNLSENLHNNDIDIHAMAPVIGKDHNVYNSGAYSLDFSMRTPRTPQEIIQHNHSYTVPEETNCLSRPQLRDKKHSLTSNKLSLSASSSTARGKSSLNDNSSIGGEVDEDTYMTRDEKRARAMNIPIPVTEIINLPMDEFNERLSKYDLSENQLSLIRDIRRRGKNKVAAQNCRKRKLDQIISLEDEVKQVRQRKEELQQQRDRLFTERKRVSTKYNALHRHIFQYLRDADGNPCSPSEHSLQQAPDGSVYLLPRNAAGNKNDSFNNGSAGDNDLNANATALLSLNINNNTTNHSRYSPMIVASSHESPQIQRSRSQVNRTQQGQQLQQHQHAPLTYDHIQHESHQQQQHVPMSSIVPTSVGAAAVNALTNNDNIITHHNGHQVPHQPQKD